MPELPEVETTVRNLKSSRASVIGARFVDVWTDSPKMVKKPKSFSLFKKKIINKKIQNIWRRGKNIIFTLSEELFLLIHQKLTGHLLAGKWERLNNKWEPIDKNSALNEAVNKYIHFLFWLDNDLMVALSDLRKFAKIEILTKKELDGELKNLGVDPLDKNFTFERFKEVLRNKKGKIKQVLMNQKIIAGIGNIYSDEILFRAGISPFRLTNSLSEEELKKIYLAMKKILNLSIRLQGESFADYRLPNGKKGGFDKMIKVYRRKGKKCFRCKGIIQREIIGGRSTYFCPKCQK